MWSRLLAIKNHREHRLRAEINRIHAQIRAQTGALEDIRRQRVESAQRWRKHSQKTCTGKADQLHQLRSELNHFYTADLQFQKEGERLQKEMEDSHKQRAELEEALKKCIKKQEKLQLVHPMEQ
ncbi:putative hydrolase [Candidatus Glomeribacter gigasporarum BEG34]|uniref:Putative hydrolase n=1 Tax=Candidatus Glomeribacter gigasporarum BEG34 TaxID=1070319 RepID=G2J8X9_9BURK|nr:hypothetical protein [Candidatus Glomeribacter gigasporarum]CCD29226.1 putative hydrolase [Candidatus Glomeribacter gigasporarum BEG34]